VVLAGGADDGGDLAVAEVRRLRRADAERSTRGRHAQGGDDGRGGDDVICGGYGDDTLLGGKGDDIVLGQENRYGPDDEYYGDTIIDGPGDDLMDGGDDLGIDYVTFEQATSGITLDQATGVVTGGSGNDTFTRIGWISGTKYDDVLKGSDNTSYIDGDDGDDTITLGGGDNLAWAGDGDDSVVGPADEIYGGAGDDYLDGKESLYGYGDAGYDECYNFRSPTGCEVVGAPSLMAPHPSDVRGRAGRGV
jgi:hypothetical protein